MLRMIVDEIKVEETVREMREAGVKVTGIEYANGKAYVFYW